MMKKTCLIILCILNFVVSFENDFKGFDDEIMFGINWPGVTENSENILGDTSEHEEQSVKPKKTEVVKVLTSNKEGYECHIPEVKNKEFINIQDYDGPSPIELLKPLFTQKICSYRLETYWGYEVCHGRYIRQYHEERDGKQIKTQEYHLGHWTAEQQSELEKKYHEEKEHNKKPNWTKVDGSTLPYVEMVFDKGTVCDLSGKPRMTRVRYVCYAHGKHEVYSFKETSTCEYEIVILSPLLCEHPHFKIEEASENVINCVPLNGAPKKPRSLLSMEVENLKLQHQTVKMTQNEKDSKDVVAVLKVEKYEKDGETHLKFELHPLMDEGENTLEDKSENSMLPDKPFPAFADDSPVRAFLNGEKCLNGGTGWWKYEFCYGKTVAQYHIDRTGARHSVLLGRFDEQAHLDWIRENQSKQPKPLDQRTSISHFYANGDICDKTGKPRQTEVKLKCLENSSHTSQVSLYLLEPRTCHYILGVESPLICDILPLADVNGLIKMPNQYAVKDEKYEDKVENENVVGEKTVFDLGND